MTPAKIRKASDAELTERGNEMWKDAHANGGMTRKGWNEWHTIREEQKRRLA